MEEPYLGTPAHTYFRSLLAGGGGRGLAAATARRVRLDDTTLDIAALPPPLIERVVSAADDDGDATRAAVFAHPRATAIPWGALDLRNAGRRVLQRLDALDLSNLHRIDLRGSAADDATVAVVVAGAPRLADIDARDCPGVSAAGYFRAITQGGASLTALGVPPSVGPAGLGGVDWGEGGVLSGITRVTGVALDVGLANRMPRLAEATIEVAAGGEGVRLPQLARINRYRKLTVNAPRTLPPRWLDGLTPDAALEELEIWADGIGFDDAGRSLVSLALPVAARTLRVLSLVVVSDAAADAARLGAELRGILPRLAHLEELTFTSGGADASMLWGELPRGLRTLRLDGRDAAVDVGIDITPTARINAALLTVVCLVAPVGVPPSGYRTLCAACVCLRELVLVDIPLCAVEFMYELRSASLGYLEVNGCEAGGGGGGGENDALISSHPTIRWNEVLHNLPLLTTLLLYGTPPLTLHQLTHILARRLLSVSSPTALGDGGAEGGSMTGPPFPSDALPTPPRPPPRLKYLNIGSDAGVTAEVVRSVVKSLAPTLEVLQLECCPALAAAVGLAEHPGLAEVCLKDTGVDADDTALAASIRNAAGLRRVVLHPRCGAGAAALAAMRTLPRLDTLSVTLVDLAPLRTLRSASLATLRLYLLPASPLAAVPDSLLSALRAQLPALRELTVDVLDE